MTIRELEIMKAALEGDIIRQKECEKVNHPAFKAWLEETEKLLKKVTNKLSVEKAKRSMLDRVRKYR